jgi:uridine phosphorylase
MMENTFLPILKTEAHNINTGVIVCGDPERARLIASRLEQPEEVSHNREYRLFNGRKNGRDITVVSHGVGAAGAAVCFEELIRGGAREIIRVGTAGSLHPDIQDGELVIASAAVREDGLTDKLVAPGYPAVGSYRLVTKLQKTSQEMNIPAHTGIVLTVAAFYPGPEGLPNNYYSRAGVIAVEMEVSALFVIASLHGIEAGAVLAIDGMAIDFEVEEYNPHREKVREAIEQEIDLALGALTQ